MLSLPRAFGLGVVAAVGITALPSAVPAADTLADEAKSSFAYEKQADGLVGVTIANVTYLVTGSFLAGRPDEERLVLRTTQSSRQVIDEVGIEAEVIVEAFPLGSPLTGDPVYTVEAHARSA